MKWLYIVFSVGNFDTITTFNIMVPIITSELLYDLAHLNRFYNLSKHIQSKLEIKAEYSLELYEVISIKSCILFGATENM